MKQYHSRSAQYEQILKKNEQMYALTAITLALCPAAQRELDETVMNTLKDKCVRAGSLAFSAICVCKPQSTSQVRRGSLGPGLQGLLCIVPVLYRLLGAPVFTRWLL